MIEQSIVLVNNPYGFRININHPKINPLYRRYKAWKHIHQEQPLTDDQRKEFEDYILKETPPSNKNF